MAGVQVQRLLAAALLCQLLAACTASLMAIDLGSEYLKVCLIKPGRTPISIVVNEMSRRKSPALVGVINDDRVLGEEAFTFAIRYPEKIFARTRDSLGRSKGDPVVSALMAEHHLPYELVDHQDRHTVAYKVNSTQSYLAEELVVSQMRPALGCSTNCQAPCPHLGCNLACT